MKRSNGLWCFACCDTSFWYLVVNIAFYLFDKSFQFFENKLGRREKPTAKKELKFLGKLHRVRNLNYERKFPQGKRDDPEPNHLIGKTHQSLRRFRLYLLLRSGWLNIPRGSILASCLSMESSWKGRSRIIDTPASIRNWTSSDLERQQLKSSFTLKTVWWFVNIPAQPAARL